MAQLMPLPLTVSCFSKIQFGFAFLVPAHPGSPGKRAVKRVCMCVLSHTVQITYYSESNNYAKIIQDNMKNEIVSGKRENNTHAGRAVIFNNWVAIGRIRVDHNFS